LTELPVIDIDEVRRVMEEYSERGWTDGLPVMPVTESYLAEFLGRTARGADEVLLAMPHLDRECTVRTAAINAAMAGCRPEYFPVVLAAWSALHLEGYVERAIWQSTTGTAPMLMVNGPIRERIGLNSQGNVFGSGFRANATIGRAIRLILMNVGGGWPGRGDMATQGSPAKYAYAVAEREDVTPWEPLHVALGFKADQSVVTVFGGEGPHNVNDHVSTTAPGILNNVADVATSLGSNVGWYLSQSQLLVVLGPEHAATIAADGFSRADVQRFVFEHARMPLGRMKLGGMWGMHDWPEWMARATDDTVRLPRVPSADDVYVMVGGGSGKHSCVVPNCTFSRAVSRPL